MGKKINSVTVFLDDLDHGRLLQEADAEDRTPAEFLRHLLRVHCRQRLVAWIEGVREKELELAATVRDRATPSSNVAPFTARARDASDPVNFSVGWADTEQQG
jgi:hypothetical protein